MLQMNGLTQEVVRFPERPITQARRFRSIGQGINPIFLVSHELFGTTIGNVLLLQKSKRRKGMFERWLSIENSVVNIRDPTRNQRHTKAIHCDMMITRIPKEPIRRGL